MVLSGKYTLQISPQECDFREQVSLPALGDIILQVAGKSADRNGFGMQKLNTINRTWVVLRMAIEMQYYPKWRDEITIETWVEEVNRAATTRHFKITDSEGRILGGASSLWAMIDVSTRRTVDLQTIEGLSAAATSVPSIIQEPGRLPSVDGDAIRTHHIRYSDIDFNHHANSMKYVEWMLDCLSLQWHQEHIVNRFEINFLHEVFYGEPVNIYLKQEDDTVSLFEIRKPDNSSVCKMRLTSTSLKSGMLMN